MKCRLGKLRRPDNSGLVSIPLHLPLFSLIVFWHLLAAPAAAGIDTVYSQLTHTEFVQRSLLTLAEEVLAGTDSTVRRELHVLPAFEDSAHHHIETAFDACLPLTNSGEHTLRYHVYLWEFSLVKKTRRWLLGRFWVRRELRVGLTVAYPPAPSVGEGKNVNFDRTYSGWVRAADLGRLESGEFASLPVPPASDFVSRWTAPVVVGAGLGALTYLFFSVR